MKQKKFSPDEIKILRGFPEKINNVSKVKLSYSDFAPGLSGQIFLFISINNDLFSSLWDNVGLPRESPSAYEQFANSDDVQILVQILKMGSFLKTFYCNSWSFQNKQFQVILGGSCTHSLYSMEEQILDFLNMKYKPSNDSVLDAISSFLKE